MPGNQLLPSVRLGALLVASLALTGCLSEGFFDAPGSVGGSGSGMGESGSRGVSLSQAMQSSASGSREPLHGSGSTEAYTPVETTVNVDASTVSGGGVAVLGVKNDDTDFTAQIPMDVAYAVPFNGEFQSITRFTLTPISVENDRMCGGIFLSGDIMELESGTLPASAIKNTWMLEAGFSGRLYLNPAHAFISPYFSASIAYQVLFWDYRNPVFVDGDEIRSDTLPGMGGYAGLGVAFNRNSHLSFFGEAGFGGTVFVEQTERGFANDVFHNFGYFMVKAGLCVKF
jgi:hypothetical protein